MSDARHGRFEIDLDEIERQLRRAADPALPVPTSAGVSPAERPLSSGPAPKSDPLAELARIVGQDDPFRGLFQDNPSGQPASSHTAPMAPPPLRPTLDPQSTDHGHPPFSREMDVVLHGERAGATSPDLDPNEDLFDPVADAYGSLDGALDHERYEPLAPPRSRKTLAITGTLVVAAALGTAGWLAWRDSGAKLASGAPPVIRADNAPLKVAPENPGGMEIPDQNKQIYERGAQDGQTRVVDRQEQPIDVREAARALPGGADAGARPGRPNPVASALGEPRRVRTVSVRPDGTLTNAPPSAAPEPAPPLPASSLPPPVPVATIPITAAGTIAAPAPAAPPTPAGPAPTPATTASASAGSPAPVSVLPPRRPKFEVRSEIAPSDETGLPLPASRPARRVASASPEEDAVAAPAGAGRFAVQLGVRGSEQEARAAFAQYVAKYPELSGHAPAIARAEVAGKTVYRVRVGNLSREDANTLCNGLKSSGGQCFVAQN
jgi:hypothetical protein